MPMDRSDHPENWERAGQMPLLGGAIDAIDESPYSVHLHEGSIVRRVDDSPTGYCPLWEVKSMVGQKLFLQRNPMHLYLNEELFLTAKTDQFVPLSWAELGQWLENDSHIGQWIPKGGAIDGKN